MNQLLQSNIEPCPEHGYTHIFHLERTNQAETLLQICCEQCDTDSLDYCGYKNSMRTTVNHTPTEEVRESVVQMWNKLQKELEKINDRK